MSELLAERDVLPLYGQVVAQDVGTADIPEWETGEEKVVASEHAVLVATRPDHIGKVKVRVLRGAVDGLGSCVFDGELSVASGRLAVGSALAGQVVEVDTGKVGYIPIQIYIDPPDLPEQVSIVLV